MQAVVSLFAGALELFKLQPLLCLTSSCYFLVLHYHSLPVSLVRVFLHHISRSVSVAAHQKSMRPIELSLLVQRRQSGHAALHIPFNEPVASLGLAAANDHQAACVSRCFGQLINIAECRSGAESTSLARVCVCDVKIVCSSLANRNQSTNHTAS